MTKVLPEDCAVIPAPETVKVPVDASAEIDVIVSLDAPDKFKVVLVVFAKDEDKSGTDA
jgi:hypothetical protein